jgi:hypothetical protein
VRNTPNGHHTPLLSARTTGQKAGHVHVEKKDNIRRNLIHPIEPLVRISCPGVARRSRNLHLAGLNQEEAWWATSRSWSADGRPARILGAMTVPIGSHCREQCATACPQTQLQALLSSQNLRCHAAEYRCFESL